MPRQFRQCMYCTNNSINNPAVVIFTAHDDMKKSLNHPLHIVLRICEDHFDTGDIKLHGQSKRLIHGALPKSYPRRDSVAFDHRYLPTKPFCLVGIRNIFVFVIFTHID